MTKGGKSGWINIPKRGPRCAYAKDQALPMMEADSLSSTSVLYDWTMVAIVSMILVVDARGEDFNLLMFDDKELTILSKSCRLLDIDCPSTAETVAWAASAGAAADVVDAALESLAASLPRKEQS